MKHTPFNNAVRDIHKLSMTPAEKQAILAQVLGIPNVVVAKQPIRSPWSVYSFGSWIQGHKLASVLAAILIVAVSGNSIVLAANESLPGDALYSLKVNVAEPIRVALAVDPVKKAEIQTSLVQSRFEEAETLAARGQLDDVKEKEISDLIDRHVAAVSRNIEKVDRVSPEKAEDTSIAVEASMNAHAKILATLGSRKTETRSRSISRIADKAREDAKKFDVVVATAAAPAAGNSRSAMSMKASSTVSTAVQDNAGSAPEEDGATEEPTPAQRASKVAVEMPVAPVAMSVSVSVPSPSLSLTTEPANTTQPATTTESQPKAATTSKKESAPAARQDRSRRAATAENSALAGVASSTRATIEVKKQQKETEIYEKAKQRLEEEYRNEELKKPASSSKNASSTDARKSSGSRGKGRFDRNN